MAQDYWWVTRPKRKLNTIPEELAAFAAVALGKKWRGNREIHIAFEEELEKSGTKRIGERRDASGSGGRTHAIMLYSLGLWFEKNEEVFLTLAGEAILEGKSPISVLKKQVLNFQYPSAYSTMRGVAVNPQFKIRPFVFLLKILSDSRINSLTQEEIAFVLLINAENESDQCYERVVKQVLEFRNSSASWKAFGDDYLTDHGATAENLLDVSNTVMNWLEYTQLVYRERKIIGIADDKKNEVIDILNHPKPFIQFPCESDIFQRKYGIDPWHRKDTRNLLNTNTVSSKAVEKNRILQVFFAYSSLKPVSKIDAETVSYISDAAGTNEKFTESVLTSTYPHGAIGGYLSNYRSMAFQGRDEAENFEKATANLFHDIFNYKSIHLGQTGAKSAPDVLIISDSEGYQAIIDNKAYSKYSISGDHHNRMVYNYLAGIHNYSNYNYPIGFFTYISGGFSNRIDQQIKSEVDESGVHGSAITVSSLTALIEDHLEHPYTHKELRTLFGLDRQVLLSDIHH